MAGDLVFSSAEKAVCPCVATVGTKLSLQIFNTHASLSVTNFPTDNDKYSRCSSDNGSLGDAIAVLMMRALMMMWEQLEGDV